MSEPIEVLIKRLTSIVRGRETAKGFHFFCQFGGKDWDEGVVTLQMSGTGWTLLSHRIFDEHGEEQDSTLYSVYLSARDMRAFVRILMEQPFWEFDTSRWEREGEETNIHIRLADTGKAFAWGVQFWSGEMERQPSVSELMNTINLIIKTVSDDELSLID